MMIIIILCLVGCISSLICVQHFGKRTNTVNDVLDYYTVYELMAMHAKYKREYNHLPWQDQMIADIEARLRYLNVNVTV